MCEAEVAEPLGGAERPECTGGTIRTYESRGGMSIKDHGRDAPRNRFGLERLREKMFDTNGHSQVMTLKQTAEHLRISKAHLANVINGKVAGVPPLRHVRAGRRILIKREWADEWLEAAAQHSPHQW